MRVGSDPLTDLICARPDPIPVIRFVPQSILGKRACDLDVSRLTLASRFCKVCLQRRVERETIAACLRPPGRILSVVTGVMEDVSWMSWKKEFLIEGKFLLLLMTIDSRLACCLKSVNQENMLGNTMRALQTTCMLAAEQLDAGVPCLRQKYFASRAIYEFPSLFLFKS